MTVGVVYDGLCLLCIRSIRVVRALDVRRRLSFHDANDRRAVLESFPMLEAVDLEEAMYAVAGSRVYRGFFAFRRLAWTSPVTWWLAPLLYLPGVALVGERVYAAVAGNRSRMGCRVEGADE
jgi:predicted DCC family thiol-disulfide oxidoreductase YuxK